MPLPAATQPMERVTVRQRAFSQIRDWIEDGTLSPGEVLRDHDIAEKLGISRTPVREALQMLEQLGAIETFPGSHTRIVDANFDDVQLVLEPLAALQALAVQSATPNVLPEDLVRLEQATADMAEALASDDALKARRADDDFHGVFLERCGNPYLVSSIEPLLHHARRLDSLYFADLEMTAAAVEDHRNILQAVSNGAAEFAAELTRRDWHTSRQRPRRRADHATAEEASEQAGDASVDEGPAEVADGSSS